MQEAEDEWERIVKSKIRWMHYANQQGWKFPDGDELHKRWPLEHFDMRKAKA